MSVSHVPAQPPVSRRRRQDRIILLALLLLATSLRVYHLDFQSLWSDEGISLLRSSLPLGEMLQTMPVEHAPGYFLLLALWLPLAGPSDFALRLLSLWPSVLAVAVAYRWAADMGSRRAGLVAALLLAVNPFQVWYAQEARMYSWLLAAALASTWLLWRLLGGRYPGLAEGTGRPSSRWWPIGLGYTVLTAATIYLHHYGFLVPLAHTIYALVSLGWTGDRRRLCALAPGRRRRCRALPALAAAPSRHFRLQRLAAPGGPVAAALALPVSLHGRRCHAGSMASVAAVALPGARGRRALGLVATRSQGWPVAGVEHCGPDGGGPGPGPAPTRFSRALHHFHERSLAHAGGRQHADRTPSPGASSFHLPISPARQSCCWPAWWLPAGWRWFVTILTPRCTSPISAPQRLASNNGSSQETSSWSMGRTRRRYSCTTIMARRRCMICARWRAPASARSMRP